MKTKLLIIGTAIVHIFYPCLAEASGLVIDLLKPPTDRKEFVTDNRLDFGKGWKSESIASFGKEFFTIAAKDYSISFDLSNGRTTIKGNYHPDKAAREFLTLLKSAAEQDRKREQQQAIAEAKLKLLREITGKDK